MSLPEIIQAHRGRLRLSQAELAQRVGVRQATISEWESGKSAPTAANLAAMAEAFGVPLREMQSTAGSPFPYAAPPQVHAVITAFEREAARIGANDPELDLVSALLRSPATTVFLRVDEDGNAVGIDEQLQKLGYLMIGLRAWLEQAIAVRQAAKPRAVVEDEPIPAPRGKSHAEAVDQYQNSNEKKPKRA